MYFICISNKEHTSCTFPYPSCYLSLTPRFCVCDWKTMISPQSVEDLLHQILIWCRILKVTSPFPSGLSLSNCNHSTLHKAPVLCVGTYDPWSTPLRASPLLRLWRGCCHPIIPSCHRLIAVTYKWALPSRYSARCPLSPWGSQSLEHHPFASSMLVFEVWLVKAVQQAPPHTLCPLKSCVHLLSYFVICFPDE